MVEIVRCYTVALVSKNLHWFYRALINKLQQHNNKHFGAIYASKYEAVALEDKQGLDAQKLQKEKIFEKLFIFDAF